METPAGIAGLVRPRRSVSIDAAHRPPEDKRNAWNGNQLPPSEHVLSRMEHKKNLIF